MLFQKLGPLNRVVIGAFWLHAPSLVMNEINSLTHSCIHSLASLAIFAFSGSAVFIILATGAKLCMLASESTRAFAPFERCCGGDDCGDKEGMAIRPVGRRNVEAADRRLAKESLIRRSCADQPRVAALYVGRKQHQSQHPSTCRCQRTKRTNHGETGAARVREPVRKCEGMQGAVTHHSR